MSRIPSIADGPIRAECSWEIKRNYNDPRQSHPATDLSIQREIDARYAMRDGDTQWLEQVLLREIEVMDEQAARKVWAVLKQAEHPVVIAVEQYRQRLPHDPHLYRAGYVIRMSLAQTIQPPPIVREHVPEVETTNWRLEYKIQLDENARLCDIIEKRLAQIRDLNREISRLDAIINPPPDTRTFWQKARDWFDRAFPEVEYDGPTGRE